MIEEQLDDIANQAALRPERNYTALTDIYDLGVEVGKKEMIDYIKDNALIDAGGFYTFDSEWLDTI